VTWGNGTTGITGYVTDANSLIGLNNDDQVGTSVTALSNGNYVVASVFGTKTCTKFEHPDMLIPGPVSTWEVLPCVDASPSG